MVESLWSDRRSALARPDETDPANTIVHARRTADRVEPPEAEASEDGTPAVATGLILRYTPSILAATLVFAGTTMVHGAMLGWHTDLLYRCCGALLIAGILWHRLQADRIRAMAIAAIAYGALFVPSDRLGEPQHVFAVFMGLLIVVAGAGLIGVQRDEFGGQRL